MDCHVAAVQTTTTTTKTNHEITTIIETNNNIENDKRIHMKVAFDDPLYLRLSEGM